MESVFPSLVFLILKGQQVLLSSFFEACYDIKLFVLII